MSLYVIAPKLTGLMVVVLPCLVGAGALIGSFLRKLSRKAQEQVSNYTLGQFVGSPDNQILGFFRNITGIYPVLLLGV